MADVDIAGKGYRPLKLTFLCSSYAIVIIFGQNKEKERTIMYYCVICKYEVLNKCSL